MTDGLDKSIYAKMRRVKELIPHEVSLVDVPGVPKARFVFRRKSSMTIADKLKELKKMIEALAEKGEAGKDDLTLLSKKIEEVIGSYPPPYGYAKSGEDSDGDKPDEGNKPASSDRGAGQSQGDLANEIKEMKSALNQLQEAVSGIIDLMEEK